MTPLTKTLCRIFVYSLSLMEVRGQGDMSIEIDGQRYAYAPKITVNAGKHEVIFYFSPRASARYVYVYQLQTIDAKPHSTIYPLVRYTNLNGGEYVFRAKVIENENVVKEFAITLYVKENFWEKGWFWLFVGIFGLSAAALLLYFWFLYDFRQRLKTEQIRQRIAADLHDEVGANLSSINFLVSSMKRKLPKNDTHSTALLEKIARSSTESAALINDTIWALNPAYDSFEKLLERIKSFAASLFSANDIAFSVENQLEKIDFELSVEQRRNLYLLLKEALNNAAKHASAQKVSLQVAPADRGLLLTVADDGLGFDPQGVSEGNGLKNYHLRALGNEIRVNVHSEKGAGTQVHIVLQTQNH